ncbi:MAG: ABC transporter substrate-binding protein, partial [Syntrophobacteraceae bacterium]|nr:ABC transporter substrate-binding protein [Syntrophobacteraceae bacterium]
PEPTPPAAASRPAPKDAEALLKQAEEAERAGRVDAAIPIWERVAQSYANTPAAAESFYRLGKVYGDRNQLEKSLQYYDYLLYAYPKWEGANQARLERLRILSLTGKKKQAMKEGVPLWEASAGNPAVQVGLSELMAGLYKSDGDTETAFDWLTAGFNVARKPEDQRVLTRATMDILKDADEGTIRRISKKNPSPFMAAFLEYRTAQIEMQKGQADSARQRMNTLLQQNPKHPLASEVQVAQRESTIASVAAQGVSSAANPNKIGCLVPLNGPYAKYGRLVLRGVSMASDDWNVNHPDQQITVVVRDAQAEPDLAVKSFGELVNQEGVLAVVGPLGAQSTKAVVPMAGKWNVPLLTLTQKDEEIPENPFVVHVFLDNRELVKALVKYCRDKLGYTRFAALYPDDRYGQKLSKVFAEVVQESGGNLLASVSYKEKSTDFKDPLTKLMNIAKKNSPPTGVDSAPFEALFIPDQVGSVSLIAPQLPYNNVVGVTLLGTNLWGEAPLVQAGGVYVEQAIFATPFFAESQ